MVFIMDKLIALMLALIPFVVLVCLMLRYQRVMVRICFVFVVGGFLIYTSGYLSTSHGFADMVYAVLRGILSTARMFSINEDYKDLVNMEGTQWLGNIWIKIVLWCCHISVIVLIQAALIFWFGRKLVDGFRLRFWPDDEVYFIKGSDKKALLLGENIATRDNPRGRPAARRVVVFLTGEDEDEKKLGEKVARFGGVVYKLDRKHNFSYRLKKARLGKKTWPVFGKERKCNIVLMPRNAFLLDDVRHIVKYAKDAKAGSDSLNIFAFTASEWDREKIEELTSEKVGGNRVYPYTIHIVNETDLLVRRMIEKRPPVKCEAFKFSGGETNHNFTVMIIGFGTVGQTALLRLMMNGQFVGSRMRAIVVDRNMDKLREYFLRRHPGLELCCDVEFEKVDVHSDEFFAILDKNRGVDYAVVALCSDNMNRQTALDMRLHYNRGDRNDFPLVAVSEKWSNLYEEANKDENEHNDKIFTFGRLEDIYKEAVIISESTDIMAKAVNDVYNKKNPDWKEDWAERSWFEQESNRAAADFIPAMLELAGLGGKDNIKRLAAEGSPLATTLAQTEHLRWNAFHIAMGWRPIPIEEMQKCHDATRDKKLCRKNPNTRSHVCLAPWDKLDEISKAYGLITKNDKEDFKRADYDIIENVPLFLDEAKKLSKEKRKNVHS
jgi:hypothetical protein